MRNKHMKPAGAAKIETSTNPELDYSPKTYSLREQIVFGTKLLAAGGIFFVVLWLIEKFVTH